MAARSETIVDGLRARQAERIRDLAVAAQAELTRSTPVDTGWARANWTFGAGESPNPMSRKALPDRPAEGAVPAAIRAAARRQRVAMAEALRMRARAISIFVSNHVPYVGQLDTSRPSAQQAPGWIRRAIERAMRATGVSGTITENRVG